MFQQRHAFARSISHLAIATLLLLWGVAASIPAVHADSGGSGGGFVTDDSPGGGGSYGSDYSGGSSYDYSQPTDYGFSDSGSSSGGGKALSWDHPVTIAMIVLFAAWCAFMVKAFVFGATSATGGPKPRTSRTMQLMHVQLAFNLLKTKDVRDAIETLVRGADVKTAAGLTTFARSLAEQLLAARDHVEYAFGSVEGDIDLMEGQGRFQALAGDARAFYKREVIRRGATGLVETTRNSPKATALLDEDGTFGIDEFLVVTLIVCTKSQHVPISQAAAGWLGVQGILTSLTDMTPQEMAGCEVIWTPAAESDVLTRDELLTGFPALMPV